ncbi:MAG: response regulator [Candidatus Aenigmarchaeota archaeon]|nr:response regulator [Candidatus Aenigmarchaeota archaeon]
MAKTIMVVDDESDIRESVRTILETNGYSVITAVDGDDCLRKLRSAKPDLILMDVMMPGTPVREVISRIKGTKIAYFTVVRTSDIEKERLLKTPNVVGFIQKPFELEDLLKAVKRLVGKT